jgi:hypothetical protein
MQGWDWPQATSSAIEIITAIEIFTVQQAL